MQIHILAFVLGVVLLQQQASLPAISWAWALLPGAASAFLLCRSHEPVFTTAGKVLFAAIFLSAGFFWAAAFAQWRLSDALPQEWEGRDIQLVGVVAELPQVNERSLRFVFDVEQAFTDGAIVPKRISLAWYGDRGTDTKTEPLQVNLPHVNAGERWRLTVRLKRPHGSINPHGFDFEEWALEHNIRATGYVRESDENVRLNDRVNRPSYQIERLRQKIRERFTQALPDHAYAGVLAALAVGDQRAIPAEQWQIFTRTGINHLMSISGLHVTMVSGLMFALVYWAWRRNGRLTLWLPARKAAAVAGLLAALGYALLAGFAVPAQRTVYMLAVVATALWWRRFTSATMILTWALLAVTLFDPWAVLSPGFWLSFGAIATIMLVSVGRIGRMHWITEWARIQWAITLGLIPALLAMFQQVSLVSPIANAIAVPLVSLVVVPLTLLATLPLLDFMLLPAHAILSGCMDLMQWMSDLPHAVWNQHAPPMWAVAAGLGGIIWMLLPGSLGFVRGFPARWLGMVALLPMFLSLPPKPGPGDLWLSVLDVGQGLAVVARTENHTLLYDAGPGSGSESDSGNRIIVPFLRGEGVKHLDAMVVTHADTDHSGGALSVLQAVPVKWLVSSLSNDHPIQLAASKKQRCQAGETWQWDGVQFDMLHPSEQSYSNSRLKTNALSCVLKISTVHGSVLLPSDIEKQSEYQLLAQAGHTLSSTVLVAPHHGSKTSSTDEFIHRVNPRLVIFTVGYRNRFGHPKDAVVERYQALGSRLLRSDADGAILLRFADDNVAVETSRALRRRYWHDVLELTNNSYH
ncbi:DNA internalization-related competence protein ComEC/Rec2 [Nitrosovibrio tenuis]|uniref:Competence protein ComEC n=1 Tax=Nitrosovibrio tenuis TaxID=1233 RepID=A0A1H7FYG0_9PROT|nr:DNA internalization-related competence protein ComEC/Rec2 [Nitrosovibrio tenuis]SEK31096.1 competence protein ComEC [Nitrosovibrio tenuis]